MSAIKDFICEFSHKLPNDLRLRTLGNKKILGKSQNSMGTQASVQPPLQKLIFDTGA